MEKASDCNGLDVLFIAANTRSLAVNRGSFIRALQERGLSVGALVPDEEFLREVHGLGVATWQYPLERHSMGVGGEISRFLALRRLIRQIAPRAVFAYSVKPIVLGIPAARLAGVAETYCLATGLGYLYGRHDRRTRLIRSLVNGCYALSGGLSRAFFFQNPDDRDELQQLALFRRFTRSVVVNGSGVDPDEYPFSEPPVTPVRFLFMGRFLQEKGIREFVSAARQVARQQGGVEFVALGDTDESTVNGVGAGEVAAWREEGIVTLPGRVRDVRGHLQAASVMVLPSYYREGIPRSLLEAMSTGRPVITCDSPGCRETVDEGVNGWLIPPCDAAALAERMQAFISDPGLIGRMGRAGRAMVLERFTTDFVNRQMLEEMPIANLGQPLGDLA
ncbi:MAG: glycosyltransferase family 4 protein [Halomonadaceae bacterium]|jgi:glycosyltransferase involved in cell wall biosynthesis|uniref:glycosyltransferase family 4 protein n=1 Tax=Halomonas sp. MCCC 1A11062 TaxID=2733485 RepID=UPI001F1C5539|nr:glycosyltransferase family 4 protein [Halomonas sp. MCCC 1A11062]MCE8037285.1 glycosyltransferase family 4 protein [Halomonas sp. MCCC 1A11062]